MLIKNILILLSAMLVASGCGRSLNRLTDDQKTVLKQSLANAEDALQAPFDARQSSNLGVLLDSNDSRAGMTNKIHQGLLNGLCKDESTAPKGAGSIRFENLHYLISGEKCPISLDFKIQVQPKELNLSLAYKVQDVDYRNLTDLSEAQLNLKFTQDGPKSATANFEGKLRFQKNGDIGISGNYKKEGPQSMSTTIRFDYPNFSAQFQRVLNQDGYKYFLNGEELSPGELQEFFKGKLPLENGPSILSLF